MLLLGVREENSWLSATFNLTFRTGWSGICAAAGMAYDDFEKPEILVDHKPVNISSKEDIPNIEESGNLTVRGISKMLKVPIMITFFNQLQTVVVWVACASDEFQEADYEKFNKSLGQYMDSLELAMYR